MPVLSTSAQNQWYSRAYKAFKGNLTWTTKPIIHMCATETERPFYQRDPWSPCPLCAGLIPRRPFCIACLLRYCDLVRRFGETGIFLMQSVEVRLQSLQSLEAASAGHRCKVQLCRRLTHRPLSSSFLQFIFIVL